MAYYNNYYSNNYVKSNNYVVLPACRAYMFLLPLKLWVRNCERSIVSPSLYEVIALSYCGASIIALFTIVKICFQLDRLWKWVESRHWYFLVKVEMMKWRYSLALKEKLLKVSMHPIACKYFGTYKCWFTSCIENQWIVVQIFFCSK